MNVDPDVPTVVTAKQGYDTVAMDGLHKNHTTLVGGTSGSAKTIFAIQFLANGILFSQEPGVFVTFAESPAEIRKHVFGLRWDIAKWQDDGKWLFVDASPQPSDSPTVVGDFDLGALLARIDYAVKKVGAKRVALDSLEAIFSRFTQTDLVRAELFRIATALKQMGVTAVLTAERWSSPDAADALTFSKVISLHDISVS